MDLLLGYTSMEIISPTLDDQIDAGKSFGKYDLGFVDLVNLSVMRRRGVTEIYSSDTGFDSIPEVRRVFHEPVDENGFKRFVETLSKTIGA